MKSPCIAIAEWNWVGHHPTYFAHFVLALEELGADVLAMCPDPQEALDMVAELRQQRASSRRAEGTTEFRGLVEAIPRLRKLLRGQIGEIDRAVRHFRTIEGIAAKWQLESGKRIDSLFYACVYDWDFQWFHCARPFLRLPWCGLYLHAQSLRRPGLVNPRTGRVPSPNQIFSGRLCKGLAILDENIVEEMAAITRKPVAVFPDFADERMPKKPAEQNLARQLREWAAGRPIVGLFGFLQPSKGVVPFLQAASHPGMANVCFAIGGEFHWALFSQEEKSLICRVLANSPNTWSHLMRIPDEAQLNSLLAACDVLCASYLDFPHSSGMVTKAAMLGKPLIVSDGYLMAERVRRFRMGEVVPQADPAALAAAINKITKHPADWQAVNCPRWPEFMQEHSFERLKDAFRKILGN